MVLQLTESVIRFRGFSYKYPESEETALLNIDFSLQKGDFVCIAGPSGSGKTTFALACCGILHNSIMGEFSGTIEICEDLINRLEMPQIANRVGIVFQNPSEQIFSSTVEDEIAFGLENLCFDPVEIKQRVDSALNVFGIEHLRSRHPSRLSGGETQKVALAAVYVMMPGVIVFDEPTSMLDANGRRSLFSAIDAILDRGGTILVTEHDREIMRLANRRLLIHEGIMLDEEESEAIFKDFLKMEYYGIDPGPLGIIAEALDDAKLKPPGEFFD